MGQEQYKVYGYRWVMLGVYMFAVAMNQMLWITFASITGDAAKFYNVSDLAIGLLSMSFMIVFIFVSIPASWIIDTYGIRLAVGIGAALTAVFGLLRGFWAGNYTLVLIAQIGIAIGQPFLLNAITTVAARWFAIRERATASGLGRSSAMAATANRQMHAIVRRIMTALLRETFPFTTSAGLRVPSAPPR